MRSLRQIAHRTTLGGRICRKLEIATPESTAHLCTSFLDIFLDARSLPRRQRSVFTDSAYGHCVVETRLSKRIDSDRMKMVRGLGRAIRHIRYPCLIS